MLPAPIVTRLRERPEAVAEGFDAATLIFADLVGFTALAERLGPQRTAALLNTLVSRWDNLAAEAGVEKIKTIGDAYFAAAGVPEPQDDHAALIVDLGHAMIRATAEVARTTGEPLAIRVGVHSGPVVAGRHRAHQVQLRPVGRHGERRQPAGVDRGAGRDPGERRHGRPARRALRGGPARAR